ncbi:hypothetical protein AMATHDRAFT_2503 [Amanita thiersii Skay4041]|uniref:MARVEL domain-containing protein n=1 Tax=Amanita thiersii Skay4041 TaxID=703135 RepID=A0A2A9NRQ0_9AGAR|nr:hypothetical protein AMATHDRAFT_2503 [Amanita thiersii Skay4041]
MSPVPTRTFCCCIPSRVGVLLIGLIGLVGGGGITALAILRIKASVGSKVSLIIEAIIYGLLALVSLLGLIGAIGRKLSLIKLYFAMLVTHLLFSFGAGTFAIYRVFHDAPEYINKCVGQRGSSGLKVCQSGVAVTKGIVITMFILVWILEIWACVIVFRYSKQLSEETAAERVVKDTEAW